MSKDDKWKKSEQPPPPMFLGEKERNLVKQINDEIIVEKTFLPPVRVHALVEYQGVETSFLEGVGIDKLTKININFHRRRLTEDQDLFVREGDFVRYGNIYYEIVKLIEPKLLFGQPEHRFEIKAECIRARDGLFNAS